MSKYNTDLDYVLLDIDITKEELEEIKAEADKIISENKKNKRNKDVKEILALAYLKKAQCRRKLESGFTYGHIYYEDVGFGIVIKKQRKSLKKLLKKALELSPNMPEALMQLGLLNQNSVSSDHNYKAISYHSMAIQLKPDYAAAFNSRAMCSFEHILFYDIDKKDKLERNKIKFRSAIADFTKAIKIRPSDAVYHLSRGTFHSRLGEHKEAVEDFSSAINLASDELKERLRTYVKIFDLRGKEYMELKNYNKAIDDFSETLRMESHYDNTPTSEEEYPKLDVGDKCSGDFFRSKPNFDETLLLRGKAYYLVGEKDKAKADFDEYKKRKHNDVDTAINKRFLNLFSDIDICKEESFFVDYIHFLSAEEYDKLPSIEEYIKNLDT